MQHDLHGYDRIKKIVIMIKEEEGIRDYYKSKEKIVMPPLKGIQKISQNIFRTLVEFG